MRHFFLALLVLCVAAPVRAATVNIDFDSDDGYRNCQRGYCDTRSHYVEEGFVVTPLDSLENGSGFGGYGSMHLDIAGGPNVNGVAFRREGDRMFRPLGVDIIPGMDPDLVRLVGAPEDDVMIEAFRDGVLVGSITATLQNLLPYRLDLSPLPVADTLRIFGKMSWNYDPIRKDGGQLAEIHFELDNVLIATLPLPGGLMLGLTGLGILAVLRKLRRALIGRKRPGSPGRPVPVPG